MIAEISAAIAAVQAVNGAIQSLKESAGHAGDLSAIVGRWAEATERVQEAERKGAGVMSYAESLRLESASRMLANYERSLKDVLIMQGQADLWNSINKRVEASRDAHEKHMAQVRAKQKQRRETIKLAGIIVSWGVGFLCVIVPGIWVYTRFFK